MKLKKAKKIRDLVWDIYHNGVDPGEFTKLTGKDWREQLYPDEGFIGEWLAEFFDPTVFLDKTEIANLYKFIGEKLNEVMRYANLPDPETIQQRVNQLLENDKYGRVEESDGEST